jgi:hypothetical protein
VRLKLKNIHAINVQDEDRHCKDGEIVEVLDERGEVLIQQGVAEPVKTKAREK